MSSKRVVVDLFYDIVSPYSWISFEMLCRYRPEWHSMCLRFKPFLLGAVFKSSGNSAPLVVASKLRHMNEDIKRLNTLYKIPIVIPNNFIEVALQKTSLKAQRFVTSISLIDPHLTEDISRQLWKRLFVTHQDITLADSFREAAKNANISEEVTEKAIVSMEQNPTKEALKKCTEEALSYGAFGAPTAVLHLPSGPQLVFGSDRMEVIASLLGEKYVGPLHKYSKL